MNGLKAPSLQSLLESDRGSTDSLLAESLQLDIEDLDDAEYSIPQLDSLPTLESVLNDFDADSDIISDGQFPAPTPTPSIADETTRAGSILRHVVLQGITSQISSAADRINAGLATAVAVCQMIAVGTSHGHILNFDNTQTLRWAHQDQNSQGAVSALSYNEDSSRLLAGFARGLVIMIDTRSGNILRSLFDSITPNSGVLNLKWTGRPALALCSDSGGSVWSLSFTRKLGIRGYASRCLFSGARGEVCSVEPLIIEEENNDLNQYCIIALATLSKYFVVTIRPRLRVIKFHPLTGPSGCLPLLAWQMVLIQAADSTRSVDPVLAVARGNQLYFHQILVNNGRVSLLFLRHVQMNCELLAVHWLGPKSVACIDVSEILHLIDVRSSKELENIDMAKAGLVYGSAQFKGLATGGNVSPALALAGTHACYNSVLSKGTQLYILGARSLHIISIRNWSERITFLVNQQRWVEACELALEGYRTAGDRIRKKQQAKDRVIELFHDYISVSNRAPEYCLGPIIKCLIEINELELLWQELWEGLNQTNLFLTIITEHIENDEVKILSPSIAQALVEFWVNLSPSKLEEIILKLNWTCLDLNQVLKAVKQKKLYKAQMYLNAHALGDYAASLTELIPLIESEHPNLGNSILVYISSCLAGRGYPHGEIPSNCVQNVKHEVLRCLTSAHSISADDDELPYPYLRALLKFDTRETLNVISLAFQEKEFCGELGLSHRQRIINILLEIMTPENATWSQIGCLLNFISQQLSTNILPDDSSLLDKVVNYLSRDEIEGETPRQHMERENAWLELISCDRLSHIPLEKQLDMAKRAKCYCVVEHLLEKEKKYDEILECYINNSQRHFEMFSYMDIHARNIERKILQQIEKNFTALLRIDSERLTKIIADNFEDSIFRLIELLNDEPKLLYSFFTNLLKIGVMLESENCEKYINLLSKEAPNNVLEFLKSNNNYRIEKALDIVKIYNLHDSVIFLYEKLGDYHMAFNLTMSLLENQIESRQLEHLITNLGALCLRASAVLPEEERENMWFTLLKFIFANSKLQTITKSILHDASQHVDLPKLVQLVLDTSETHSNNFGDIKDLLMGMLTNSKYEQILVENTAQILGQDLHLKFCKKRKDAKRGLWIAIVKCIVCRQRLYNQTDNIFIFGICGHAIHKSCLKEVQNDDNLHCPRCGSSIINQSPIILAEPKSEIIKSINCDEIVNRNKGVSETSELHLKSPPRNF
ncbi:vacuolar protein sorting-associated protein 8 homolog [Condylostylus longicornis]|uniref:vacuolar protein sorting-associated protein 8 homolog n=1 Tax=Condylostylus longicornis TaxID=2530218 RepID=UPI00244DF703|nr:vacuolar protein sorting-associated protein 8 homolog [Condylostylus longicornis]